MTIISEQQKHKEECHVRWMLITQTRRKCIEWLNNKPESDRERFRTMLNEQKAALKELSKSERNDIAEGRTTMKSILAMKRLHA